MLENKTEGLLREFHKTSPVPKESEGDFDEVGRDITWEQFKWKVVEPYIRIINSQTKTIREFILIIIFIFLPIFFSYLHGLGLWLFKLTRINFDIDFVGYAFLLVLFCSCMSAIFFLKK